MVGGVTVVVGRLNVPLDWGAEVQAASNTMAARTPPTDSRTIPPVWRQTEAVGDVVRAILEVGMVVAVGGMLWTAGRRLRRGEIRVYRCAGCARPTSRGYPRCRHCGLGQPDAL